MVVSAHTDYPRSGRIRLTVEEGPAGTPWTLSLRIPQWSAGHRATVGGTAVTAAPQDGWLRLERAWSPGDEVVLDLDVRPRLVEADPRVDAVRGCVAIERGPLVHAVEQVDLPADRNLLTTVTDRHGMDFGVLAEVRRPGRLTADTPAHLT